MRETRQRLLLVVNRHSYGSATVAAWEAESRRLRDGADVRAELETSPVGNQARIIEAIATHQPEAVIAAGGDGTVRDAVCALRAANSSAALGVVPLGTANNFARSLGLQSWRAGSSALSLATDAILSGTERAIDLGEVNGEVFAGSFAVGMDADILVLRNKWKTRVPAAVAGYPLYLWSCAVNSFRPHGGAARMRVDGGEWGEVVLFNLLLTNAPIYAGEFRFVIGDRMSDGVLDVLHSPGPGNYLHRYASAWPRHLRATRGKPHDSDRGVWSASEVEIELGRAVPIQVDGEEGTPASKFRVRVLPSALKVLAPLVVPA